MLAASASLFWLVQRNQVCGALAGNAALQTGTSGAPRTSQTCSPSRRAHQLHQGSESRHLD